MQHQDSYFTISQSGEGLYKEKGSKFIAYSRKIQSVEEFEIFHNDISKLHPKARHLCYAYRLDPAGREFRINDDGEPGGSAGKPIMGQLESLNVHYTAVIVVRYFGGTKLGVSGLISAYKLAAREALLNSNIIEEWKKSLITISFSYDKMGVLLNALKELKTEMIKKDLSENPSLVIAVKASETDHVKRSIIGKLLHRSIEDIIGDEVIMGLTIDTP